MIVSAALIPHDELGHDLYPIDLCPLPGPCSGWDDLWAEDPDAQEAETKNQMHPPQTKRLCCRVG